MNEQKLIELWKSGAITDLPEINFELFQRSINSWKKKLRRKIELDILVSTIGAIVFVGFAFYDPRVIYFFPVVFGATAWYYYSLWKINKQESAIGDQSSTKVFLETKLLLLNSFIWKTRVLGLVGCPVVAFATLFIAPEYDAMFTDPGIAVRTFGIVLAAALLGGLGFEIFLRAFYVPPMDELKELLDQMEGE